MGRAPVSDHGLEPGERGGVEDRHEVLEVLAYNDVERYLERGLLTVGAAQRRAVALGQQREREGDGEERDRRDGCARTSSEPDGREPGRDSTAPAIRPPARRGGEHPRDENRGRNRDETGKQEQQESPSPGRSASLSSLATPPRSATPATASARIATKSSSSKPSAFPLPERDRDPHERSRRERRRGGEPEPARREDALLQDIGRRRACDSCGQDRDGDPDEPPAEDSRDRDGRALHPAEERQLPGARTGPREAAPRGLEIAAHPPRGEDREGEQQRRAFSTHEEETVSRDVRRSLRCAQLLDRSVDVERRLRCEVDPRALRPGEEVVHVPQARAPGVHRPHPGIRAIRARERGRGGQRGTPLRDDERRGRGPVVLRALTELG